MQDKQFTLFLFFLEGKSKSADGELTLTSGSSTFPIEASRSGPDTFGFSTDRSAFNPLTSNLGPEKSVLCLPALTLGPETPDFG